MDSRGRVLESKFPWGHVSAGQCWPVRPVQTKHRRNGLGPGPGFAQAAFEAAPTGSSWDLPPFELRWRAGFPSPAPRRAGAAITMATAVSRPCAGGSRDILWRVSLARIVARSRPLRGSGWAGAYGACAQGVGGLARGERAGSAWGACGKRLGRGRRDTLVAGCREWAEGKLAAGCVCAGRPRASSLRDEKGFQRGLVRLGGMTCMELGREWGRGLCRSGVPRGGKITW